MEIRIRKTARVILTLVIPTIAALVLMIVIPYLIEQDRFFRPGYRELLAAQSPTRAASYLMLGLLSWLTLLMMYASCYLLPFLRYRVSGKQNRAMSEVQQLRVESKNILRQRRNTQVLKLVCSYVNRYNSQVYFPLILIFKGRESKHIVAGASIDFRHTKNLRWPIIKLEGTDFKLLFRYRILHLLIFTTLLGYASFSLLTSYKYQAMGYGWNYLHLQHPFIITPILLLSAWLLFVKILKLIPSNSAPFLFRHKDYIFNGIIAEAKVTSIKEMRSYINEMPQFRLTLRFKDKERGNHYVSVKEHVPPLLLHTLDTSTRQVIYLPDQADKAILADDFLSL